MNIHPNCIDESMNCKAAICNPTIGMLGTKFCGSDRYGVVIAKVYTPKKVLILDVDENLLNQYKVVEDGLEYFPEEIVEKLFERRCPNKKNYTPEHYGTFAKEAYDYDIEHFYSKNTYKLRKNGRWIESGQGLWSPGAIHFGVADPYTDPDF